MQMLFKISPFSFLAYVTHIEMTSPLFDSRSDNVCGPLCAHLN